MADERGTLELRPLPDRGIYCLIIELTTSRTVGVGALGTLLFEPGTYVYVGSAQANLPARVARHLRKEKKLRWHIDYLLEVADIRDVFVFAGPKEWECAINRLVAQRLGAIQPTEGFGSSDCSCRSHLTFLGGSTSLEFLEQQLREGLTGGEGCE